MINLQTGAKIIIEHAPSMSTMDAIYKRRAIRSYKQQPISREDIKILLSAAVQAPTAIHEEPWAFAIIQDRDLLKKLSDSAKTLIDTQTRKHLSHLLGDSGFNIFYNAGTLIIIYGKPMGPFVVADCWLAAENLMLAACAMGLGTCVIGLAVPALNAPEWKKELGISLDLTAYVPMILGVPEGYTSPVPRKEPEIIAWKQ
ncbi:MAG: nitroreductase family protein [Micavibrio sp.]